MKILLLLIWTITLPLKALAVCSTPPNYSEMNQQFYDWLTQTAKKNQVSIAILPFQDGTQIDRDEILEQGLAILHYDLLSRSSSVNFFHPFAVFQKIKATGLDHQNYFNDEKALELGKSLGATHVVYGMFQKKPNQLLRYFMKIKEVASGKRIGPVYEFQSELGDRLFNVAVDSAAEVARKLSGTKIKKESFSAYLKYAPTFQSFRYYVKGMQSSHTYQESQLAIAKVWFEKSITESYHFADAYREKARTQFMLALVKKQMQKEYAYLLNQAQGDWDTYTKKIKFPQKKSKKTQNFLGGPSTQRWIQAATHFNSGVSLLTSNQKSLAQSELQKAVKLLPEDGMAHYYLSQTGGGSGSSLELAQRLNPCL